MNWTADDLKALDQAIAMGVRKVEYHDKYVEYRSLADQLRIRKLMVAYLFPTQSGRRSRVYASLSKGTRP